MQTHDVDGCQARALNDAGVLATQFKLAIAVTVTIAVEGTGGRGIQNRRRRTIGSGIARS